jgi:3-dehydroquinate synthase
MITVQVDLGERSYPIWIGTQVLTHQIENARELFPQWKHAYCVVDEHLDGIFEQMAGKLQAQGIRVSRFTVSSGESSKSVDQLNSLWNDMLQQKVDRKSILLLVGGGVVGDLGGFAASTFMRGVRFIQIPTTLLSMVDSSVGGKTGVNLPQAKNAVGTFWQPSGVMIDTVHLGSLPNREYSSGLAEVVKYGVILDADFFDYLERHAGALLERSPASLEYVIQRSCELKAGVVQKDERETSGLRAILNYGHTFGHAIEATTSYGRYLHGEAIAIGMTMAGYLAVQRKLWTPQDFDRQTSLLERLQLPTKLADSVATHSMLQAMQLDKKTEHGVLHLILPTRMGHVQSFREIPSAEVAGAIDRQRG